VRAYGVTRRAALHLVGVLTGFWLTTRMSALPRVRSVPADALASKLTSLFSIRASAAVVGREYLRCTPGEAKLSLLVDLICSLREERHREIANADGAELRQLLVLQQQRDLEEDRIVHVNGWVLSHTEARLCGLAALM
jgi:hypothetical protein